MRDALLVAGREYLANIRTRSFWLSVILNPIILIVMFTVPVLLSRTTEARRFAVIDNSGWLWHEVETRMITADAERLLRRSVALSPGTQNGGPAWPPAILERRDAAQQEGGKAIPQLAAELSANSDFRRWWEQLDPRTAAGYGADLSRAEFVPVELEGGSTEQQERQARQLFDRAKDPLFAYFVIDADPVGGAQPNRYVCNTLTDDALRDWFHRHAARLVRERRAAAEGVTVAQMAKIDREFEFEKRQVAASGEEKKVSSSDELRQWAPLGFVYLLWISVFSTAMMLMQGTLEEKQGKLVEVLLSSISTFQLMAGKLLGIAATGLTLVGGWGLIYFVLFLALPRMGSALADVDLAALLREPLFLASFVIYYVLGYLFYAGLMMAIGAVCSTMQEAQNLMAPVTITLMIPLVAMFPIGKNPNGMLARILSFIPPFTPFVMMNRAAGPPALWEYVVTTLLLVISVGAVLWASAKVFRIGILMTGKAPRPREIIKWLWVKA